MLPKRYWMRATVLIERRQQSDDDGRVRHCIHRTIDDAALQE
jgi:hypothetical protein